MPPDPADPAAAEPADHAAEKDREYDSERIEKPYAGVWFLYDGDCPMCRSVARAVRITHRYGSLFLLDARHSADHPLYAEVTRLGLDLDEGMVVHADGRFFHGAEALVFVARFGDPRNPLTLLSMAAFRLRSVAAVVYPVLRAVRNLLLWIRGIGRIDNLGREP